MLSKSEEEEPIIECKINGKIVEAMVDTGATYTCLKPPEVRLVKSNSLLRTVGFSGKKTSIAMSQPIDIEIEGKTVRTQVLMAEHAPNLIGRDVLCTLYAKITMTPWGLALQCPVKEEKMENQTVRSVAYWVKAKEIMKKGQKEIKHRKGRLPRLKGHCTTRYSEGGRDKKYEKEIRIGEKINLTTDGIIISNVGAAVRLRRVEGFKVEESCPHVSLYVYGDHRARELGREIQKSWRKDWVKTQGHWVSSDGEIELYNFDMSEEGTREEIMMEEYAE